MRILISFALSVSSALASVPVRDGCSEDATVLANIQEGDPIQVSHGVLGESLPCYAVAVNQAGNEIRGFILGSTLPAIQEFERRLAVEARVTLPEPPPAAEPASKAIAAPRPTGPLFEAWSGVTLDGKRMHIAPGDAKVILVTFWTAQSGAARHAVESVMKVESEFRPRGLRSYGLVQAPSAERAKYYLDDMGLDSPQALDRQSLAAKYHADPVRGTTLILDQSNHIIAASSNPAEIRAAVAKLLSSE
jgi:hypothetical protein